MSHATMHGTGVLQVKFMSDCSALNSVLITLIFLHDNLGTLSFDRHCPRYLLHLMAVRYLSIHVCMHLHKHSIAQDDQSNPLAISTEQKPTSSRRPDEVDLEAYRGSIGTGLTSLLPPSRLVGEEGRVMIVCQW